MRSIRPIRFLLISLLIVSRSGFFSSAFAQQGDFLRLPSLASAEIDDPLKGLALIEELNCARCHASTSSALTNPKLAPRLSGITERIDPAYIQQFIQAPHATKPGTTMPDAMVHLDEEEKHQAAAAITQFLLNQTDQAGFDLVEIDRVAADIGEQLFNSVGCAACHSPRTLDGVEWMPGSSVPLGRLEKKYNLHSLAAFLKRPHTVRPSGRMPDLKLSSREASQIANFLLQDTRVPGHLNFKILQGRVWEGLDANVESIRAGLVDDFELDRLDKLAHNSAVVYDGFLTVERAGEYRFSAEFNGGQLLIDGRPVIDLPPSDRRGPKSAEGRLELYRGKHTIELTYFHTGQDPFIKFQIEGPALEMQPIPASMLTNSFEPIPAFEPLPRDPALVATGQNYFVSLGCAACHDDIALPDIAQSRSAPVGNGSSRGLAEIELRGPPMSELDAQKGCLSRGIGAWPSYALDDEQRELIGRVLPELESMTLSPKSLVDMRLASLNCIACHQRQGVGRVAAERDELFVGTRPELGNEGRLPPPLDHVGAKLSEAALGAALLQGDPQRTYLATRMPIFGESNVRPLLDALPQVDAMEEVAFEPIASEAEVKQVGRLLMGSDGFSCIACHDFNGQLALGPGALDIIDSTARLQKDWFYRFMLEPGKFRRGTIMPSSWPDGHVFKTELLNGDAKKQIESIWVYLSDGRRAANPEGLSRQASEIRVTDVAEICRGRGIAGYRGIAVGFPERLNLAYDSEQMNLKLLWKGDFVNVNHGSFQASGGQRIEFPDGIPFHRLESLEDNWPYKRKLDYTFPRDQGYQFQGYQLDEQRRPTFLFEYRGIQIEETWIDVLAEDGNAFFRRTFTFDAPEAQDEFYFRAAADANLILDENSSPTAFTGKQLKVRILSSHTGIVRKGEPDELLIPLALPAGQSQLILEYKWLLPRFDD